MWIARDYDGRLYEYDCKPIYNRISHSYYCLCIGWKYRELSSTFMPSLRHIDGPVWKRIVPNSIVLENWKLCGGL